MSRVSIRVGNSVVNYSVETLKEIATWLVKQSYGDYFIVMETGKEHEGRHIHCYMTISGKCQALRKRAKKQFCTLGRGNYSMKPPADNDPPVTDEQWDAWLTYACKGERRGDFPHDRIFYNSMMSRDEIEERHKKYWDIKEERERQVIDATVNDNTVVINEPPKKKKRTLGVVEQVYEILINANVEREWSASRHSDRKDVFHAVMRRLGYLGKVLDPVTVARMCYGVLNMLDCDSTSAFIWERMGPYTERMHVDDF